MRPTNRVSTGNFRSKKHLGSKSQVIDFSVLTNLFIGSLLLTKDLREWIGRECTPEAFRPKTGESWWRSHAIAIKTEGSSKVLCPKRWAQDDISTESQFPLRETYC